MFVIGANSTATGYNLTRSLRFRASASAYLNRTPASATNRQTWTYSAWVKLTAYNPVVVGNDSYLLTTKFDGVAPYATTISINPSYKLVFASYDGSGGSPSLNLVTTQVFRDYSAWYHIVVVADTTQATAANRAKMYVNGVQITSFSTATYPSQNYNTYVNKNDVTVIGALYYSGGGPYGYYNPLDGYTAETNLIDGQALTPSSFGSTNALTGVWQPARYTGSYGTNGFYLPFTDNSALTTASNAGLGKDFSGNGNYFPTTNISITAGVTYDSMTDVPTLTSATAANFAVLNPLWATPSGAVTSNGNLSCTNNYYSIASSISVSSGKWYCEFTRGSTSTLIGIVPLGFNIGTDPGASATSYAYQDAGKKYNSGTLTTYGATYTTGDVIGVAMDLDGGNLTFYKNGVSQGVAFTGISGTYFFAFSAIAAGVSSINFGQRPFSYTPPTNFVALNTFNLPTSTIVKGNTVMDATLYTGTGATQSITNAAAFKPDLVWIKNRSAADDNQLVDSVRGVTLRLISNGTNAESANAAGLTAFNSNGFTIGSDANYNRSGSSLVGWQWQAGQGTTSSNTNGTITSTVSVNASAGFSVVTYTGTGANATVGHGLGVALGWLIVKRRTTAGGSWVVWHSAFAGTERIDLDSTAAKSTDATAWNSTSPSSSVFSIGTSGGTNLSAATYVAYCWTPIAGFSAFGSYTGNGSTDGPFVYTGFRPKFIMIKRTDNVGDWWMYDTSRSTFNTAVLILYANTSAAEISDSNVDMLSNGFKFRTASTQPNTNGGTFIYMAFAENPFKNALAR